MTTLTEGEVTCADAGKEVLQTAGVTKPWHFMLLTCNVLGTEGQRKTEVAQLCSSEHFWRKDCCPGNARLFSVLQLWQTLSSVTLWKVTAGVQCENQPKTQGKNQTPPKVSDSCDLWKNQKRSLPFLLISAWASWAVCSFCLPLITRQDVDRTQPRLRFGEKSLKRAHGAVQASSSRETSDVIPYKTAGQSHVMLPYTWSPASPKPSFLQQAHEKQGKITFRKHC